MIWSSLHVLVLYDNPASIVIRAEVYHPVHSLSTSFCGSSKIMTPINGSVKMSPYEKGDNFIEPEGAAAIDGVEPGRARRPHG